jgi:hypothetical protein
VNEEELVPDAELMESMRAVGYSLKTAIADICDNSVSANARKIKINWSDSPKPFVSIFDDGDGMEKEVLRQAMKLAGKSPLASRAKNDLGRFGLGLKTASLSQARSLTVITARQGSVFAARWDLDFLRTSERWALQWLDEPEYSSSPGYEQIRNAKSGTLVVWEKLDLLVAGDDPDSTYLAERFDEVADHLGLVFHRFLGPRSRRLEIFVNERAVPVFDPFLEGEPGVVDRGITTIRVNGEHISVQPFILPSINKMTRSQRERAIFDQAKMREAQGFYIYRNMRLLTWGTWFRMAPLDEAGKLARVRVDTDNSLDSQWKLGIMKSAVQPPKPLLDALKQLVPQIVNNARRASLGKSIVKSNPVSEIWRVNELGEHAFELAINLDHPLISGLSDSLDETQRRALLACLKLLEAGFPATYVHHRLSKDSSMNEGLRSDAEVWLVAEAIFDQLRAVSNFDDSEIWHMVEAVEPFASNTQLKSRLRLIRNGAKE